MANVYSRFAVNPTDTTIRRTKMDQPHSHKTTFNAGKLVPIELIECLPGSTYSLDLQSFVRMSTPIHPVMDDCYMDIHFYFVPMRLLWDHFEEFMGASSSAWTQPVEYTIPQISFPNATGNHKFAKGSVADHFGIPTNVSGGTFNALPFRAYVKIWNEWYRDQNLQDEILEFKDDTRRRGDRGENDDFMTTAQLGGALCPVAKYHDYFTSSLPDPQKGPDVSLPIQPPDLVSDGVMKFTGSNGSLTYSMGKWTSSGLNLQQGNSSGTGSFDSNNPGAYTYDSGIQIDDSIIGPTVNQLRMAFGLQRMYEKDALYGTRYTEILRGHFQTTSPDFRLQRSEYIGGRHFTLNMSQVLQTSQTTVDSPQGNTAAFSATADRDHVFTYSCVEHGYIIGLAMVRNAQSYQQGMDRLWMRERRYDFYWPELAELGNVPVYNGEIYYSGDTIQDREVFGYQEAWADYRYRPSRVTGAFRSNYTGGSLDIWHYADYYTSRPVLGDAWIRATSQNIDRTLAVSSDVEDQFLCEFKFNLTAVLPMPLYSMGAALGRH